MTMREASRQSVRALANSSWWTMRHVVLAWKWTLAPLCDDWHGLSLTRFIAVFICVIVGHRTFVHEDPLNWTTLWFMVLAIATAFGKLSFDALAQRLPRNE